MSGNEPKLTEKDRETDADLGYAKRYIAEIHNFIIGGGKMCKDDRVKVKEAHALLQSVYCRANPSKIPD